MSERFTGTFSPGPNRPGVCLDAPRKGQRVLIASSEDVSGLKDRDPVRCVVDGEVAMEVEPLEPNPVDTAEH